MMMKLNAVLDDEAGRLAALHRLDILDTSEEPAFENVMNLVRQVLNVPICAVSFVDRDRQWFKARRGLDVCETAREISFCTHATRQADPLIVRDAKQDERFADNPLVTGSPFIRSYAGIPLTMPDGYNVGTLCAIDTVPRPFPEHEIAILSSFARVVQDALELRLIASSDSLTGALTRGAWRDRAETEFERARRFDRPLSLSILDIDNFKALNDTYGHAAGDEVIKRVSQLCMSEIRESDHFGRYGGEEFVLLMPETTCDGAFLVAERIRTKISEAVVEIPQPIRCTASFGVGQLKRQDQDIRSLFDRVDRALYRAKSDGRNRTAQENARESAAASAA